MFRRAPKPVASNQTEAHALAMVLLEPAPTRTSAALASVWRSTWPDVPGPTDVDSDDEQHGPGAMTLRLDTMTAALAVMPVPIPGGELDGPAATSWLWLWIDFRAFLDQGR